MNDPAPPPEIEIQADPQDGGPPRSLRWVIAVIVVVFAWWWSLISSLATSTPGHRADALRLIAIGMVPAVLAAWKLPTTRRFRIVMLAVAALLPAYNVIFFVWPFP